MGNQLQALAEKFSTLGNTRAAAVEMLQAAKGINGEQFNFSLKIPTLDETPADLDARILAISELGKSIGIDDDAALIPRAYVSALMNPLDSLIAQYASISDVLKNIADNGGVGSLDLESFAIQNPNGQFRLDAKESFQRIRKLADGTLEHLYPLLHIVSAKGLADFSAATHTYSQILKEIHQQRIELTSIATEAKNDRKKIGDVLGKIIPSHEEAERLKGEVEKDRKTIAEYVGEGTQAIAAIRALNEQAEQLKSAVESYKSAFDNFQTQLNQREQTIASGTQRQGELLKSIEEIESKIKELNERAEGMLSGATVAGLAGSYGELRDKLSADLNKARNAFYFAIFLLFVSVLPLAAYIIPGLGEFLSLSSAAGQSASAAELVAQILARALLLLPPAWFAKFAAGRHAQLFRLKEHYAYKYSVAASVEGFKKQAEPFKEAIVATTFFELTFNPANRMDSKVQEDRHPNPAMDWFMKKLGATYDGGNK